MAETAQAISPQQAPRLISVRVHPAVASLIERQARTAMLKRVLQVVELMQKEKGK